MKPTSSPLRFFYGALLGLVLSTLGFAAGWEEVKYNGHDYVTVRSIKEFYKFDTLTRSGRNLILENKAIEVRFLVGGQDVWMNNIKFIFSYPVVPHGGRYLISRTDLSKLVDPVLRPQYIRRSKPFTTVIIDPGHGGKDSGAVASKYNTEKYYTLRVARKLREELTKRKFKVVMTRDSDTYLSLNERVRLANRIDNAIFISIHFNSGGRGRAEGIETFTLSPVGVAHYGRGVKASDLERNTGNAQDSANIALATAVHSTSILMTRRPDRGIRRARYSVLTGVKHPAILFEGGFLSHAFESRLIDNDAYQNTLAKSIANAVVKYKIATERKLAQRR